MQAPQVDYFSDPKVIVDPHAYFASAREIAAVWREPFHDVMILSGYDQVADVLGRNDGTFSSAVSVVGPIPPLPFEVQGDDITGPLEKCRADLAWSAHLTTMDGKSHSALRGLLTPLLTFRRLKANEDYLRGLVDRVLDRLVEKGTFDVATEFAHAIATYAISDLMGIPEEERQLLVELLGAPPSQIDGDAVHRVGPDPLVFLKDRFDGYLKARQEEQTADLMSELVQSKFRDGSSPDFDSLSNLARFLFGAGQDTTARLVTMATRILGENPELQRRVREDPSRIPEMLEETLRWDGPVKMVYRLALKDTMLGDIAVPAGTILGASLMAANNDPAKYPDPRKFDIDRGQLRDHLGFSRGAHGCIGAPLARLEAKIAIEHLLLRTSDIRISELHHGPAGERRYDFEPTYSFRSLSNLYVEVSPATAESASDRKAAISSTTPA